MKRSILLLTIAAVALLLAGESQAGRNSITGEAALGSKDLKAQTIEVGNETFLVTPDTLLRDQDGNPISLAQIPVPEVGKEGGDWPVLGASFKAMRVGSDNVLVRLRLIERPH